MTHHLEVSSNDLEALALCLTLGTLEAMRSGNWPSEAGIWTIGRPVFWQPLADAGVDGAIISVLQAADELSALEELLGRAAVDAELDRMISVVRLRLSALPNQSWYTRWVSHP